MIKMFKSNLLDFFKVLTKPFILAVMQVGAFWLLPGLPLNIFFSLVVKGLVFLIIWIIGLFITGEFKRLKLELQRARGIKE